MIIYGISRTFQTDLETLEKKVSAALQQEGFGVLTRIDLQAKFKAKLGVDFDKYIILGACNPPNAYKAIQAEPDIGLMLPCNVVLYTRDNSTVVSIIRPSVAMGMIDNPGLAAVAGTVEEKLQRVLDSL